MYRFALRPRWILSHLLALAIVAACIVAGFWQLDRLDQRRSANALQEARGELPVVPVTDLLEPVDPAATDEAADAVEQQVDEVVLRPVGVTGTYQIEDQVTVANRTFEGAPGYWVLTPLLTDDGTGVLVNRGWIPMALGDDASPADPPSGEVTVVGTIAASQRRGSFGATDPDEGRLDRLARADVGRVAAQVDYPLLPAYINLSAQEPAQPADVPTPIPPVELGEGPHQGYAVQWFIFAAIAAGGYPLILRKVARERAAEREAAISPNGDGPESASSLDSKPKKRRRYSSYVPVDD